MPTLNHSSAIEATIVRPFCGMFPTMVEYKDRLQKAMDEAGVSANKLADELDTTYQGVKKVIDGKSNAFSAANNAKAARFLGVSGDWLAIGEGPMRVTDYWPFDRIDQDKVRALGRDDRMALQAGIIFAAAELNLDIKTPAKAEKKAM